MKNIIFYIFVLFAFTGCIRKQHNSLSDCMTAELQQITLQGNLNTPRAEISGMAFHRGRYILLPQYPDRFNEGKYDYFFSIEIKQLEEYFASDHPKPVIPQKIPVIISQEIYKLPGFEGFEALTFIEDSIYVTVETRIRNKMQGYLVKGIVQSDFSLITLLPRTITEIPAQTSLNNMCEETIVANNKMLFTIHEANGVNVNNVHEITLFDSRLQPVKKIDFPSVEFRITDATAVDAENQFWVINYLYAGEHDLLKPRKEENISENKTVERLLQLKIADDKIERTKTPPLYLHLRDGEESHNWEGLARYKNEGFLIITDRFPGTTLALIPYQEDLYKQ